MRGGGTVRWRQGQSEILTEMDEKKREGRKIEAERESERLEHRKRKTYKYIERGWVMERESETQKEEDREIEREGG